MKGINCLGYRIEETWLESSLNEEIMGILVGIEGALLPLHTQKGIPALFTQPLEVMGPALWLLFRLHPN